MCRVLAQPWGGLGDNLQFTTLPELYASAGLDFWISTNNCYRNHEIHELVWGTNPFVLGYSSKQPNTGDIGYVRHYKYRSSVYNWEFLHDFRPLNVCPKLYYSPDVHSELNDVIFADLSAITQHPVGSNHITAYILRRFPNNRICIPRFTRKVGVKREVDLGNTFEIIDVQSIFHYAEIIASCKHFLCSFSGSSVLASALNKRDTTCITLSSNVSSDYVYPNIHYHFIDSSLKTKLRHLLRQRIINGSF